MTGRVRAEPDAVPEDERRQFLHVFRIHLGALMLQQRRFHPRFVLSIDEAYPEGGEDAVQRDTAQEAAFERLRLPVLGAIFFAETASVIIQTAYFKYTKRRTGEGRLHRG